MEDGREIELGSDSVNLSIGPSLNGVLTRVDSASLNHLGKVVDRV